MSVRSSPALLLRSHPYSESSRILRFLTPDLGVVAVLARGVRSRSSKGEGGMETFDEGTLVFTHRPDRELHSFRDFQRTGGRRLLGTDLRRFAGASLLAEVLLAHTLEEGDPELFTWIVDTLRALATVPEDGIPARILTGVWRTLSHLGFTPSLDHCVRCGERVVFPEGEGAPTEFPRFDAAGGGLRCPRCAAEGSGGRMGPGATAHLRALLAGDPPDPLPGARVHLALLEGFVHHHLAGRRAFHSFALLAPLFGDPSGA